MLKLNLQKYFICLIAFIFLVRCTHTAALKPCLKPKSDKDTSAAIAETRDESLQVVLPDSLRELDFAVAFIDSEPFSAAEESVKKTSSFIVDDPAASADSPTVPLTKTNTYSFFPVRTRKVRVLLQQGVSRCALYSVGEIVIAQNRRGAKSKIRSRIVLQRINGDSTILISAGTQKYIISLPCTLSSVSDYNFIEFDNNKTYRGALILTKSAGSGFSVINYLDVEEYLRGVVPLELGNRGKGEFEALKAQAVAARTYTYSKIMAMSAKDYDLLTCVADQVYGGTTAENHISDQAIRQTKDIIMVYKDSLVDAYYHSTCGGRTANITDVWNNSNKPYLVSVSDTDANGKPYCLFSNSFDWTESWPNEKLVSLIRTYYPESHKKANIRGTIKNITVTSRFQCGRIASCLIEIQGETYKFCCDRLRFTLRQNNSNNSILKSANFSVEEVTPQKITIRGRGYGHGVGMCQMGAIGRSRAGQQFEQILQAYYMGITLKKIWIAK